MPREDALAPPPLVAEHDTWVSVDPVLGCPAACDYCYLGRRGLRTARPTPRMTAAGAVAALDEHLAGRVDTTPVAIGNYTDMAMTPANRDYLVEFAEIFAAAFPARPLVVITKSPRIADIAAQLAATAHPILAFLSYSFSDQSDYPLERGPVADFNDVLSSTAVLASHLNLHPVHYWRPFLARLNPATALPGRVAALADAGATSSVVVGFKSHDARQQWWSPSTVAMLTEDDTLRTGDEHFPLERWHLLGEVAVEKSYAVYRNSSCAVAHVLGTADALHTYEGVEAAHHCLSTTCPASQRAVCKKSADMVISAEDVASTLQLLPLGPDGAVDHTARGGHLTVRGVLTETEANIATHVGAMRVRSDRTLREKEWVNFDSPTISTPEPS